MQMIRLLLFLFLIGIGANAQLTIKGRITSDTGEALPFVYVSFNEFNTLSNSQGQYQITLPSKGNYSIEVELLSFETLRVEKVISENQTLNFQLQPEIVELMESVIVHQHDVEIQNKEKLNSSFFIENYTGNIASTLEKLPGIQSMEIGSGTSKPVIRGLGFNRISVSENGIKQEGQQWGADHGLEISPWSVEKVEIIKGSGTLEFGSDAMGGVISIQNNQKPRPNSFDGSISLLGKSVNEAIGGAFKLQQRKNHFYWKLSGSYTDFADYSIPTESIRYLDRNIPIYNERLKNSAGNEYTTNLQLGYSHLDFENTINLSWFEQKLGFFPGAHGVPDLSRVEDDGNRRDLDFPFQNVQHLKISNESRLRFSNGTLKFLAAIQKNHRQEFSEFHTHYGNSHTAPIKNPDLELDFNLTTYDSKLSYSTKLISSWETNVGLQSQIQQNKINGYSFLLPKFDRQNYAIFWTNDWKLSSKWWLNFGLRWDYTQLEIGEYFDEHLNQFLLQNGHSPGSASALSFRSQAFSKEYSNFNYAFGFLYQPLSKFDINLNVSSNFRVPNAIELSSNGIHHGSFRHERGNPNLDPEKGWSTDLKFTYHPTNWRFEVNPYLYYYQNYLFLEPTVQFSPLPNGGQIYQYNQTKAFIAGIDLLIEKKFWNRLTGTFSAEYLYNQQLDENGNYPLPFSPPMQLFSEWKLDLFQLNPAIRNSHISVQFKHAFEQNRIAKNEQITKGYTLVGASLQTQVEFGKWKPFFILSAQNIFNQKYFNHMSYYRALEIPEMGRNIQIIVQIPI